jgi:hypothetical protein
MKKEPTMSLFNSFLLFCIAILLLICTAPIGFFYALLRQFFSGKLKTLNVFFIEVAIAIDNTGNVMMQYLLNDLLLIKRPTTYYFGNKKETISSVIGKNSLTNTLSPLGKALDAFLNWIDKDHSFNSIMYDVRRWARDKVE